MRKDDVVYVGNTLDRTRAAVGKVKGKSRAEFDADENLRLALTYLVQNIGEAARRVSATFQEAHGEIPWRKVIGMRHKVVHDYLDIDLDTVWEVATANLPELLCALERIVPSDLENPGIPS
jgi:uncharacterized protein with HEPN domain